jgi:hypothetical protein
MAPQTARRSEISAALAREIAAVEDEYRAALQAAARDLQPTKAGTAAVEGSVASGPLVELNAEAAMTIQLLETRLDQLKEIQQWAKIDPLLLRFAQRTEVGAPAPATSSPQQPNAPVPPPVTRRSLAPLILVAMIAFIAGWLISFAVPASFLLGR